MTETELVTRLRTAGCVFAEEEADLLVSAASSPEALEAMVRRRVAGEPLEYLLGWVDLAGVRVAVEPGVFIPRQRTTFLVELAVAALDADSSAAGPAVVLDLCCGSGALGLAVAQGRPGVVLHASDSDPRAVTCARANLAAVGGVVHHGDLDAALPSGLRGRVDVLLANVPYVPSGAVDLMPADSREHEPRSTVDGGSDGLDLLRRLAQRAPLWLRPGGILLSEIGHAQAAAASVAFEAAGLRAQVHHDDERGATVVGGEMPR